MPATLVLEDNLLYCYFRNMETPKNQGGGDELNEFTVNPTFLLQDMPVDFFDFQFIMNAD
jgi:hypothetical protein